MHRQPCSSDHRNVKMGSNHTAAAPSRQRARNENSAKTTSTGKVATDTCELSAVLWFLVTVFLIQLLGVSGGPILLLPENMQGPVSVARNIRHLPCISRRTGAEGVCMFAIDCLKSNGSHLGTCIDRFYFGSCCQIPEKQINLPITGIEDNSIDGVGTESNKYENPEKVEKPESVNDVLKPEHKTESDQDAKKTTALPEATSSNLTTESRTTDVPYKISTFQTVEVGTANSTVAISVTTVKPVTLKPQNTFKPQFGTKKPQRPVQKPTPKPTYRPQRPPLRPNATRPFNTTSTTVYTTVSRPVLNSTSRPRPTRPVAQLNTTRKPIPYKPPPKRPAPTKRPVNQPPRLNITFISQSSTIKPGTKPLVTGKPHVSTITYINTTNLAQDERTTTERLISTTVVPKISSTSLPLTTLELTESPILSTQPEKPVKAESAEKINLVTNPSSETPVGKITTFTSIEEKPIEKITESTPTSEKIEERPEPENTTKSPDMTISTVVTEKLTEKPIITTKDPEPTKLSTTSDETKNPIVTTPIVTEKPLPTNAFPEVTMPEKDTTMSDINEKETEEKETTPQKDEVSPPPELTPEVVPDKETTLEKDEVPSKDTEIPSSSNAPVIQEDIKPELSTEYPSLVTWSSNVDTITKLPEAESTSQENWSPVTPPEGWILISSLRPTESSVSPSSQSSEIITTPLVSSTTASTEKTKPEMENPTPEMDKPTTEIVKPSPETQKPILEIEIPTERPMSEIPVPVHDLPVTVHEVPATVQEVPVTVHEIPVTVNEVPVTVNEVPVTVNEVPVTVNEIPVTVNETPVTVHETPITVNETPVTVHEIPVTVHEIPVTVPEIPVTINEKPVTVTDRLPPVTVEITEKPTVTEAEVTEATVAEFTVNVTLSPTVPSSTEAMTTVSSVSSNVTDSLAVGNFSANASTTESVTESSQNVTANVTSEAATPAPHPDINMTNFKDVCGRRLWPEARIVGGAKSGFGRWPWQISLRQWRTSTYLHKCGAALLNENWAITAAHCVEHVPPSELLVRLGEHDLAHEAEPYGFAERRVQIVASHPHFDPATFEYDLALLRFYEPVTFQPNILPVCVPDNDENFVGKTAYVTGWGRLYDEGPLPSVLQEVSVPVINNTACEAMYRAAGYNEHIPNIFICAGWKKGGFDSCEGDSGGPMVVQRADNRFVLGGIISWGIGCAEPNQPGVYTRISEFRDWINQILQF